MLKLFLLISMLLSFSYAQDISQEDTSSYTLGEGLKIDSLGIYIGGYFSTKYESSEHEKEYGLEDVALISYGNFEKFSYMAEFEYINFYMVKEKDNDSYRVQDTNIHIEQLYADYDYDENHKFRVGKFNSPIGFWNLVPVNVLRETTSNPISTTRVFPKFTTGAMLTYSSYADNELQIDVIVQNNDDLDYKYNNYHSDEHFGLGITYTISDLSLKTNIGSFEHLFNNGTAEFLYYGLVSLNYEVQDFKIMSELGTQYTSSKKTTPYAGYLQASYSVTEKNSAILRLESYDDKLRYRQESTAIVAYTYRPLLPIALKAEYQFHSIEENNQVLFSFSVLF